MAATAFTQRVLCFFGLALFLALPASGEAEEAGQVLDKTPIHIATRDQKFTFQVELAKTPEERRIGLMHRQHMAPDHGMLFDFGETGPVSMWMRNTYIPLDMLFLRADGEIVNIAHDTVPFSEAILTSEGPVRAVLEVPAGTSRLLGIEPGDRVLHPTLGSAEK